MIAPARGPEDDSNAAATSTTLRRARRTIGAALLAETAPSKTVLVPALPRWKKCLLLLWFTATVLGYVAILIGIWT